MDALPAVITENLEGIRELCVKRKVTRLTLFGSAANGRFNSRKSDVGDLWEALRETLRRNVDLLVASTIKDPYLADAIRESHRDLYTA